MRLVPILLGLAALISCGNRTPPLSHTHDSVDALARAVLHAIEARDPDALRTMALTRDEFEAVVWPELPAARPERNLSVGYVWGDLSQKSNVTLARTMSAHGGKAYELVSARFLGETTRYQSFAVHRETELTVKEPNGETREVRLFGSVIEKDGKFKVFSYVVAD